MCRKNRQCEKKYSAYELEVLAVINDVNKLLIYLLEINFTVVTDWVAFMKTMKKDVKLLVVTESMHREGY